MCRVVRTGVRDEGFGMMPLSLTPAIRFSSRSLELWCLEPKEGDGRGSTPCDRVHPSPPGLAR